MSDIDEVIRIKPRYTYETVLFWYLHIKDYTLKNCFKKTAVSFAIKDVLSVHKKNNRFFITLKNGDILTTKQSINSHLLEKKSAQNVDCLDGKKLFQFLRKYSCSTYGYSIIFLQILLIKILEFKLTNSDLPTESIIKLQQGIGILAVIFFHITLITYPIFHGTLFKKIQKNSLFLKLQNLDRLTMIFIGTFTFLTGTIPIFLRNSDIIINRLLFLKMFIF